MVTMAGTRLTYQEYLDRPETLCRFEIVDGEVIMSAAASVCRQRTSRRALMPLHLFVDERGLGEVLYAPLDVVAQLEPLRVRQPDLLLISKERAGIVREGRIYGGPDLVVEILSPSNRRAELEGKLADYARIGVRECWVVSPEAHTVEVLALDNGGWRRVSIRGVGEQVESVVLAGLELAVGAIFRGV